MTSTYLSPADVWRLNTTLGGFTLILLFNSAVGVLGLMFYNAFVFSDEGVTRVGISTTWELKWKQIDSYYFCNDADVPEIRKLVLCRKKRKYAVHFDPNEQSETQICSLLEHHRVPRRKQEETESVWTSKKALG